ncbi:AbrB/MazE/SpoVT family DNA-binding domain-containing protein [Sagittula salina]|uniref:AbrB/MazE/SpoVT family DNA-binding domain-containing protein n=1 Tax=Sagittula salina TaxID=2820268 RepID=A0A940S2G0_9RHOB|nr:AbrB/MazE/SpoVT family DNA-binding domain-containing protein [Sagittula salina]MBP0484052.1 AbrB/MazE/SpoVT family DNA-binding domain-containing protein [Sagittula salina]
MPFIKKWGTALVVRIPGALVRSLGLREDDQVALRAEGDSIAVSRKELPMEDGFPEAFRNARGLVGPDIDLKS